MELNVGSEWAQGKAQVQQLVEPLLKISRKRWYDICRDDEAVQSHKLLCSDVTTERTKLLQQHPRPVELLRSENKVVVVHISLRVGREWVPVKDTPGDILVDRERQLFHFLRHAPDLSLLHGNDQLWQG